MAEIVRFPVHYASPGKVWCEPLQLFFPRLYRGVAHRTADHLASSHGGDEESIHYSLLPDGTSVAGSVNWIETTRIAPGERVESLLIRHHATLDIANAYLLGYMDMTFDLNTNNADDLGFANTDSGFFTMISRPTLPAWPGALVIYLADIPFDEVTLREDWAYVVGPDGTELSSQLVVCL